MATQEAEEARRPTHDNHVTFLCVCGRCAVMFESRFLSPVPPPPRQHLRCGLSALSSVCCFLSPSLCAGVVQPPSPSSAYPPLKGIYMHVYMYVCGVCVRS